MPMKFHFSFALHMAHWGTGDIEHLLEESYRAVSEHPNDKSACDRLSQVCHILTSTGKVRSRGELQDSIMQIALELADLEMFRRSVRFLEGKFSSSQVSKIVKAISDHGLQAVRPP